MGRYDKIKVYKGSWKTPKRIRAYLDGWVDLGKNTSYVTKSLKVRDGKKWVRATLNRRDYSNVVGEEYAYGQFYLYPKSAYCYNPNKASFGFYMKVMKESEGDKNLLSVTNDKGDHVPYFIVTWRNDGRIAIRNKYTGYAEGSIVSDGVYGTNEYIAVNIYASRGSKYVTLEILGRESKQAYLGGAFSNVGSTTVVGDSGLRYKEGFTCYGAAYSNNTNGFVEFTITDQYGETDTHSAISQSDKYTESGAVWE